MTDRAYEMSDICLLGSRGLLQRPGPCAGVDAAFGGLGPIGNDTTVILIVLVLTVSLPCQAYLLYSSQVFVIYCHVYSK